MTDLTISISSEAAAKLDAEAKARGVPRETIAAEVVESALWDSGDLSWEDDVRRLEEAGEDIDSDMVFAELRQTVEKARSEKA